MQDSPGVCGAAARQFWLNPDLHAPARARKAAREVMSKWGLPELLADTATLLASELVTNAMLHGRGDQTPEDIGFYLALVPGGVLLQVDDSSQMPPHLIPRIAPESLSDESLPEGQQGLLLVAELSADWGYRARPDGVPGKSVWCLVTQGEEG
jgi:anti-sigma regulatory factor (Ser/Thr protein kinase)